MEAKEKLPEWEPPKIEDLDDFKDSLGGGKPDVEAGVEKDRVPGGTPISGPS